jgi:hypothetical protein
LSYTHALYLHGSILVLKSRLELGQVWGEGGKGRKMAASTATTDDNGVWVTPVRGDVLFDPADGTLDIHNVVWPHCPSALDFAETA